MKRVYIYCEGQTEEGFINNVFYPYFFNIGITVNPIICTTKRTISVKYKGGVKNFSKIANELSILSKSHPNEIFTTMFDFYGMPMDTPGIANTDTNIYRRIETIESEIDNNLGLNNLFFNLILHEFEGLLFSRPNEFANITDVRIVEKLCAIKDEFTNPELINNSPITAPSKRLEALIENYPKVQAGSIVGGAIGIDTMMKECKHFANWIEKIKVFVNV